MVTPFMLKRPELVFLVTVFACKPARAEPPLFANSDRCLACHDGMTTPSGEDVSIGFAWRSSVMANSSRDPYWQASVRREVMDHPSATRLIEDECSACHMPMTRFMAKNAGREGKIFAHLPVGRRNEPSALQAADGVSCTLCHQIQPDLLGTSKSFDAGFVIDTRRPWGERLALGPFDVDVGQVRIMQSSSAFVPARAEHLGRSEMCASCHTLYTTALDDRGRQVGRLPEQVPYLEWQASAYRDQKSCQECHMTFTSEPAPAANVLAEPRPRLARHGFQGANVLLLGMLNRHRGELAVAALPQELDAAVRRTTTLLGQAATLAIEHGAVYGHTLQAEVAVTNTSGHKLPTAYPARRAWLRVTVRAADGRVVFSSGALRPDGSIEGNDNDRDGARHEPHHQIIETAAQVQIYESIMIDHRGKVTTGLLSGVRYVKDNRLLPRGFDKRTAPNDAAVHGGAAEDPDFQGGGERVLFRVPLPAGSIGPYRIEAELLYQPIGFRWAHNLARYRAAEPARFLGYYKEMASTSAVVLARASATVEAVEKP